MSSALKSCFAAVRRAATGVCAPRKYKPTSARICSRCSMKRCDCSRPAMKTFKRVRGYAAESSRSDPRFEKARLRKSRGSLNGSAMPIHAYSRDSTTKPAAMSSAPKRECQYAIRTVDLPWRLSKKFCARSRSVPRPSWLGASAAGPASRMYFSTAVTLIGQSRCCVTG